MPFEKWESGDDLFNSLDKEHDLLDRDLRLWAEECDRMQGIQMFTGADDAWGGFAARYVERVGDEFGKLGIWVWGLEEGQRSQRVSDVDLDRGITSHMVGGCGDCIFTTI